MSPRVLIILWSALGVVSLGALVFIIFRPAVWARLVDRENDFWVRRGWIPVRLADKIKTLEKGFTMKLIFGALFLISLTVVCVLLRTPPPRHFKAMMPPVAPIIRRPSR